MKKSGKLHIVGSEWNHLFKPMFEERDYEVLDDIVGADFALFTGGSDVNPSLYGQGIHPTTSIDTRRDDYDKCKFLSARNLRVPMVGVCRGAQFLNIMEGGELYQHVDNHGDYHKVLDKDTNTERWVNSTHHQMMIPPPKSLSKNYRVLGVAQSVSTFKHKVDSGGEIHVSKGDTLDTEVILFRSPKMLCYQPHPEFASNGEETREWFFKLLEKYILN